MIWMQKIDPRLPALVALEFASELQSGTQITALVPRISKRADTLLQSKSSSPPTAANMNMVTDAVDGEKTEAAATAENVNRINFVRNSRPQSQPDAGKWRNSCSSYQPRNNQSTSSRPQFNLQGSRQTNPFCPGCQYLGSQLKLQVKYNHFPANCPRRDRVVKMIQAEQENDEEGNDHVTKILNEINKLNSPYLVKVIIQSRTLNL